MALRILFYSPLQGRSKDTESVMEALVKSGDEVFLLTQFLSKEYHIACAQLGVSCFHTDVFGTNGIMRKIKQILFLVRFCKKHNIDIVYSQLEPANFIAVLSRFFMKSKVVTVRHHVDEIERTSSKVAHWISILTYKLSRHIVVVSRRSKDYMCLRENIDPDKIHIIPLGYDFSKWSFQDNDFIRSKRKELRADFILITAARLVKGKRVDLSVKILSRLIRKGVNAKLLILGEGLEENGLKRLAERLGIGNNVIFAGFVRNVLDYIAISDMLVNLSVIDSSSVIIKEAAIAEKPVIVCRGVGDCDEFIQDGVNGFLVDKDDPEEEAFEKILAYYENRDAYSEMAARLNRFISHNFSIDRVKEQYRRLHYLLIDRS